MKIHILSKLQEGPWGGGNQFQKAIKKSFHSKGNYTESLTEADIVLVNSHNWGDRLWELFHWRRSQRHRRILHRVDGPISLVRGKPQQIYIDQSIFAFNKYFADATIFQSNWSRERCWEIGMANEKPYLTVLNAPDSSIFFPPKLQDQDSKICLIANSWSNNFRKGFEVYHYLDKHLDYNRFAFTFVGNAPLAFKNIRNLSPLNSKELANELRKHDLYITASVDDPCSNSLIEAMHCGLVPLARNSGGHPEIVGNAGVLFENQQDVLERLEEAAEAQKKFRSQRNLPFIDDVGQQYLNFATDILSQSNEQKLSWIDLSKVAACHYWIQTRNFLTNS